LLQPVRRRPAQAVFARAGLKSTDLKSLDFLAIVSSGTRDETILPRDETISCFGADIRKRRMVIRVATKRRTAPAANPETVK
jgi:hypothetical protein